MSFTITPPSNLTNALIEAANITAASEENYAALVQIGTGVNNNSVLNERRNYEWRLDFEDRSEIVESLEDEVYGKNPSEELTEFRKRMATVFFEEAFKAKKINLLRTCIGGKSHEHHLVHVFNRRDEVEHLDAMINENEEERIRDEEILEKRIKMDRMILEKKIGMERILLKKRNETRDRKTHNMEQLRNRKRYEINEAMKELTEDEEVFRRCEPLLWTLDKEQGPVEDWERERVSDSWREVDREDWRLREKKDKRKADRLERDHLARIKKEREETKIKKEEENRIKKEEE